MSALTAALIGVSSVGALQAQEKRVPANFGSLESATEEVARAKALAWFKTAVNNDAIKLQTFENIWRGTERPIIDRLADTFAVGNPEAAKLLTEARDIAAPAPTEIPAILKDAKQSAFFRANLGLAYARSLSNRRVHEESLEILKSIKAEDVIDPNSYLFHRAISEHAMLLKADAGKTITRLIQDTVDSPERYRTVGALILLDMQTWKEKDLMAVARKMSDVERRLELARGGPQTQKAQKEIIARLDELIKELENQSKNCSACNGGSCPNGGEPKPGSNPGANPTSPMQDTNLNPGAAGTGRVDQVRLRKMTEGWGKMNDNQRAQAMQELDDITRGLSLQHQEQYRDYFRRLAELETSRR